MFVLQRVDMCMLVLFNVFLCICGLLCDRFNALCICIDLLWWLYVSVNFLCVFVCRFWVIKFDCVDFLPLLYFGVCFRVLQHVGLSMCGSFNDWLRVVVGFILLVCVCFIFLIFACVYVCYIVCGCVNMFFNLFILLGFALCGCAYVCVLMCVYFGIVIRRCLCVCVRVWFL